MKKLFTFFLFMVMSITINAQENAHMKFMGVSMNEPLDKFVSLLVEKGLILVPEEKRTDPSPDVKELNGTFFGRPAVFFVQYTMTTSKVYLVQILIENASSMARIKLRDDIFNVIKKKYICSGAFGNEPNCAFQSPIYIHEKSNFCFTFDYNPIGSIMFDESKYSNGLEIYYFDMTNFQLNQKNNEDDI